MTMIMIKKSKKNDKEFLNQFCVNLNDKASKLKIDPVIAEKKKFKEQFTYFREETKTTLFLLVSQGLVKLP